MYIESINLSEDEYLTKAGEVYKDMMARNLLYEDFSKSYLDNGGNAKDLNNAFEKYVDKRTPWMARVKYPVYAGALQI